MIFLYYALYLPNIIGLAMAWLAARTAARQFHLRRRFDTLKLYGVANLLCYGLYIGFIVAISLTPIGIGGILLIPMSSIWIFLVLPTAYWILNSYSIGPFWRTFWIPVLSLLLVVAGAMASVALNHEGFSL